ncbi:MAG: tRNA epoxyqueuosine(34) reductase QueG [Caulobacteraceae bacterium]
MTTSTSSDPREAIRDKAAELGFEACGFASAANAWLEGDRLDAFLAAGRHGTMDWMRSTAARRRHPTAMWAEARSAIVVGMNYGPDHDPMASLARRSRGTTSVYAQGRDYHQLIKGRLKTLAGFVARRLGGEVKVFVDTAPLMEKPLARRAGLGWQGKHTNLVSRDYGSWLFLGSVLTSLELAADPPEEDHCGACRACLDICPTGAIVAPYQLDARACISYLTIEHDGPVPVAFRQALGNRIYGCDDCLAVCPWNKFAKVASEARFHAHPESGGADLAGLSRLDDVAFRARFTASPIKRIGRDRFVRNVLYAIGNSGDPALRAAAADRLEDDCETVRDAALWAMGRLAAIPIQTGRGG